jgi:hypothetical protein
VLATRLVIALAALALCALLVAGYVFSGNLRHTVAVGDVTLPQSTCDLNRGACRVTLPDGAELTAEITPRPIAVMRPLTVRLSWPNGEKNNVSLDLAGVDMTMGENHNILQETGSGQYLGQATLPVCVTGVMRWHAEFILDNGEGRSIVPFAFSSGE